MAVVFFILLLSIFHCAFGKCIEWKISTCGDCGSDTSALYICGTANEYSNGQTLSLSEYNAKLSANCVKCLSGTVTCTTTDQTYSLDCSKTETSNSVVEAVIEEAEDILLEEGVIASAGVLAIAALIPPPLPMFPPLGLPQPLAIQGGITQVAGGGVLPSAALTVNI